MSTLIRAEISEKNKYWIDKHRHYELKHFCLQYPSWKKTYSDLGNVNISLSMIERVPSNGLPSDPTARRAVMRTSYAEKIHLIERTAMDTDKGLYPYLIKGVTEGLSYTYLKTKMGIPCGRSTYYDLYRRFFWLLSNSRE